MTPSALIEFEQVCFGYTPERQVFSGLSARVFPDERLGIIGPNGSGKTTFLHLLVGLLKPTAGTIRVFGKVRRSEQDFYEVRIRAGLVFQDADDQLFCPTVLDDVAFGPLNLGKTAGKAREIALQTLAMLGIEDFAGRITYKLSYGEKRLVALAAVLAMQPDMLLLDEPTNGLDDRSKQRLSEVLYTLPQTMILISHEQEFMQIHTTRTIRITANGAFQ
ncbi:MAG: ABC transporter ATP-binding protein [Candidatus Vecturithrix sp.]|jgi:cobalt/nickel transport system ATP-binding protein|nr:ABC transporter ATP-binding protein [Candidatus Vecturithrix sp.]